MAFEWFVGSLYRSVLVGSMYLLMSLGLTLTYSTSRYPNFSHGDLVMVGAYAAVVASTQAGLDFVTATALGAVTGAIVALLCFILVFQPLLKRIKSLTILLVASVAVGLILRNLVSFLAVHASLMEVKHPFPIEVMYTVGGLPITNLFVSGVATSIVLVTLLYIMLIKTKIGKAMRALANNQVLAEACGINTNRIQYFTWSIGGALAGIAGSFWGWYSDITPNVGYQTFLQFFAANVLGGLVSFPATIVGAYIVGAAENICMDTMNIYFGVPVALKPIVSFSIIIAVLMIRPSGLAGITLPSLRTKKRTKLVEMA